MKLIADSGSTTTEWRLIIDDEDTIPFVSDGLNPTHKETEQIHSELQELMMPVCGDHISEVYFYGAGITNNKQRNTLESALNEKFKGAKISVENDLLGAARALFGTESGIACILGTGSNSCLYEKGNIREQIPALGYILGDEGSGTDIGKRLINALLKKSLPEDLTKQIVAEEKLEIQHIIDKVYKGDLPAKYLASFAKIADKYIENNSIQTLIHNAFNDFIDHNVMKYSSEKDLKIGFIGSVAHHFEEILRNVCMEKEIPVKKILTSPIDELVVFHK